MPWVRFDDQFPIHRRIAGLSDGAFRLHVAAICWCARNLTDGYVAAVDVEHVSRTRRPWRQVDELVGAGAWHVVDGGWQIHDYLNYQPSKAQTVDKREKRAAAGRLGGINSGKSRRSNEYRSKPEAKPKQRASRLVEPRPSSFLKEGEGGAAAANGQAAAAPPHAGCRRCDGYGWINNPDGTATRCTSPIFEAGSA